MRNGFCFSTFFGAGGWWTKGFFFDGGDKNLKIMLGLVLDELRIKRGWGFCFIVLGCCLGDRAYMI